MSASFDAAIPVILDHEGGFVNDVHDPGGATKYGISLRFLRSLGVDLDGDGDVDAQDIAAMTRAEAVDFYRAFFWDPGQLERLADQRVATKVFDVSVNMGPRRAVMLCRRSCGLPETKEWSAWPPFDAINAVDPTKWLNSLCYEQKRLYAHLIAENPKLEKFRGGWYTRAAWPFHPAAFMGAE